MDVLFQWIEGHSDRNDASEESYQRANSGA